jgi:hypothetical protein
MLCQVHNMKAGMLKLYKYVNQISGSPTGECESSGLLCFVVW